MKLYSQSTQFTMENPGYRFPTLIRIDQPTNAVNVLRDRLSARTFSYGGEKKPQLVQANAPLPANALMYYFEVFIQSDAAVAVSVGFAEDISLPRSQQSATQHRCFYDGNGTAWRDRPDERTEVRPYGRKMASGDTIGACIKLRTGEVFFTRGGEALPVAFTGVPTHLYPTVEFKSAAHVEINFGQKPFVYDVKSCVAQELEQHYASIVSAPALLPPLQVAREFLAFAAFPKTLAALDAEAGSQAEGKPLPLLDDCLPTIQLRREIMNLILTGDVDAAVKRIQGTLPAAVLSLAKEAALAGPGASSALAAVSATSTAGGEPPDLQCTNGIVITANCNSVGNGIVSPQKTGTADPGGEGTLSSPLSPTAAGPGSLAPEVVAALSDMCVQLSCQRFIEMMRSGRVEAAGAFARSVLAPLRDAPLVRAAVSLLACLPAPPQPLSLHQYLLSQRRREAVAAAVNRTLLTLSTSENGRNDSDDGGGSAGERGSTSPVSCTLERVLQQLLRVRNAPAPSASPDITDDNGGGGKSALRWQGIFIDERVSAAGLVERSQEPAGPQLHPRSSRNPQQRNSPEVTLS